MHQRYHRYVPRYDYISGVSNPVADALSRRFDLPWTELMPHLIPPHVSESWLSSVDPVIGVSFRNHLCAALETVSKGVCSGCAHASIGIWDQWLTFCSELGIDPFLQTSEDKIPVLQVFICRVRPGKLVANGGKLRSRLVKDYLRGFAQTFLAMETKDPRLNAAHKTDFPIA